MLGTGKGRRPLDSALHTRTHGLANPAPALRLFLTVTASKQPMSSAAARSTAAAPGASTAAAAGYWRAGGWTGGLRALKSSNAAL
jgi:hypothetical protein